MVDGRHTVICHVGQLWAQLGSLIHPGEGLLFRNQALKIIHRDSENAPQQTLTGSGGVAGTDPKRTFGCYRW